MDRHSPTLYTLTKMSFFTPIQLSLLTDVAISRSERLEMEALQPYADYLYDIIVEELTRDRALLFSDLYKAAHTTDTPGLVSVPFWKFNACHPLPEFHDALRPDSYLGVSDITCSCYGSSWSLPPVSLDVLFRKTDICARLSAFLGPENMWVHPVHTTLTSSTEELQVWENELMLDFHPHGLPPDCLERIDAVKAKYTTSYVARPLDEGEFIERSGDAGRPAPRTPEVAAEVPTSPPRFVLRRPSTLTADDDDEPVSPPCFCQSCYD
jgi:hypothetical protein